MGVRPTRFYSNMQEKSVAKAVKGKQTPNSGATSFIKGDVVNDHFLIECKTTTTCRDSVAVKRQWLDKNREERFAMGKSYSALAFNFEPNGQNYYVIDEALFKYLLDCIDKEDDLK